MPEDEETYRVYLGIGPEDALPSLIPHWTLHDLRRTATTGMARLNFAPHVVDRILNHTSGTISGVAAVYNKHAYSAERRQALDGWANFVMALVNGPADNIVTLQAVG
jgi:integrase